MRARMHMHMRMHNRTQARSHPNIHTPQLGGQLVHLGPGGGAALLSFDLLKLVLTGGGGGRVSGYEDRRRVHEIE